MLLLPVGTGTCQSMRSVRRGRTGTRSGSAGRRPKYKHTSVVDPDSKGFSNVVDPDRTGIPDRDPHR